MIKERFVVDSNFFIQAHRVTYPLDVATGFYISFPRSCVGMHTELTNR